MVLPLPASLIPGLVVRFQLFLGSWQSPANTWEPLSPRFTSRTRKPLKVVPLAVTSPRVIRNVESTFKHFQGADKRLPHLALLRLPQLDVHRARASFTASGFRQSLSVFSRHRHSSYVEPHFHRIAPGSVSTPGTSRCSQIACHVGD